MTITNVRLTKKSIVKFLGRDCLVCYRSSLGESQMVCTIIGYDGNLNLIFSKGDSVRQLSMSRITRVVYKPIRFIPLKAFLETTPKISSHVTHVLEKLTTLEEFELFTRRNKICKNGTFERIGLKKLGIQFDALVYDWMLIDAIGTVSITPLALIDYYGEEILFCIYKYKFALFRKGLLELVTHDDPQIQMIIDLVAQKNAHLSTNSFNDILALL